MMLRCACCYSWRRSDVRPVRSVSRRSASPPRCRSPDPDPLTEDIAQNLQQHLLYASQSSAARPSSAEHCVPHKPRKLRQQHGAAPRRRVALREAASLNALVPDDCSDLDVFEPAVERVEPLQLPSVLGPHAPARLSHHHI